MTSDDRHFVIHANVAKADAGLRLGSKVEVLSVPGDPERVEVRGMSRGGRKITKYIATHRLKNFRAQWTHRPLCMCWATREEAERVIADRLERTSSPKDT